MDALLTARPVTTVADAEKQSECLLDGLKAATVTPGEHRLFRWGKLGGLFPSRVGPSAAAAKYALTTGLLEHVRTEARGKLIVEWVRALPKAGEYLDEHDSPKAVLRELQDVIGATRTGVPVWMAQSRDEVSQLALRFEHTAREMMRRLDALAERVDAALERVTVTRPRIGEGILQRVPWATEALAYLDRNEEGVTLAGLHRAAGPNLSLADFHAGVRTLYDAGLVTLSAADEGVGEPEYAVEVGGRMVWFVRR